jgi:hypothetical protein
MASCFAAWGSGTAPGVGGAAPDWFEGVRVALTEPGRFRVMSGVKPGLEGSAWERARCA